MTFSKAVHTRRAVAQRMLTAVSERARTWRGGREGSSDKNEAEKRPDCSAACGPEGAWRRVTVTEFYKVTADDGTQQVLDELREDILGGTSRRTRCGRPGDPRRGCLCGDGEEAGRAKCGRSRSAGRRLLTAEGPAALRVPARGAARLHQAGVDTGPELTFSSTLLPGPIGA